MDTTIMINRSKKKQQGVVLIVSLVFLIALTAVAGALMQNSTSDMKMSGASGEKVVATHEAISAVDETIFCQLEGAANSFASPLVLFPLTVTPCLVATNTQGNTTATIVVINNPQLLEPDCPHSRSASSVQILTCNTLELQVNRAYGRKATSVVATNSGISQQLLR